MPSLLLTAAPAAPILPADHVARPALSSWACPRAVGEAGMKELAVGDEQDARYAARQVEIEQAYADLSAPGTPAYWQALAGAQGAAPPLETLVRCCRERLAAGEEAHANRIYELVLGRSQRPTQFWARKIARQVPSHSRQALEEQLEQECDVELWRVMSDPGQEFILINFDHMLQRIQDHVAHAVMEQESYWKRRGVGTPKRVPRKLTDSVDRPAHDADDPDATALPLADVGAEEAFGWVELAADVDALLDELSPADRALLYDLYWRGLSQEEIADQLGVTDRTIRNRRDRILALLRRLLAGEEGYPHGD